MSWPAAPLCAPRAAGPNLPILARGLRGCPGRASGGLSTWGPIFGGKSGFRALSPRAQKRTYSGALARTHSRDTGHEVGGQFRPNLFLKSSKKQVLWGILTGPPSREGVLGPDLRVLILLEYPGVSPEVLRGRQWWRNPGGPRSLPR
jgi:hypothetical protein